MHPQYDQPVADYPRFHAQRDPDSIAYIDGGHLCSYGELDARSNRVANALQDAGCKPGDRIAYLGVNSGSYVETFFGANKARVVYVGVNWRLAPAELAFILNDAGVKLVVADEAFLSCLEELRNQVPSLQHIIGAERETFGRWRDAQPDVDPSMAHSPDDSILQFYTSGTTGKPKGVMISNRAMGEHRHSEDQFGYWYLKSEPREVSINAMPNFHIGGLGWLLIGLFRGAKVILMPAPEPGAFLDYVEHEKVTHLFVVPVVLGMMLEEQKKSPRDLSSLKVIHYGASAIAPTMLREALEVMKVKFCQYYGMTETNGVITYLPPECHDLNQPGRLKSCGRAVPGTQIKICDGEGKELPRGESGEIWARSEGVMQGYWNRPDATAAAFVDGWYRSGDGGRMDEDGFVYITDRIKDMIVSGGENIYPSEVENALLEHGDVFEAAVVGVPHEKWGEALKAYVVCKECKNLSGEELIDFLRSRLAGYKIPRQYEFVAELPRTASGKIQKFRLRA
ncbi:long-chain-fatty-acid--CoA ligase [Marinobacter salarius]|uniref:long-chain-fatty-acid--CoA ligase n=1 Tax=Marinobacter salarius TaxID=1420917 RepID=UPI0032EF026B